MKRILFAFILGCSGVFAQDAPKSDAEETATDLANVKLGTPLANGPITAEDLKGKAVAIVLWGIN
jgi:hypothetical protein